MTVKQAKSRCWAEVDLSVIRHNYLTACAAANGAAVIPVLKANAYGLGAKEVSKALSAAGANLFAVAEIEEAREVKRACGKDVLVMGVTPDEYVHTAVKEDIVMTLTDTRQADIMNAAAKKLGKTARVHIKLDTGLHRLGLSPDTAYEDILSVSKRENMRIEGLFTHLALRNRESDREQIAILTHLADELNKNNIDFGMLHALDSIGLVLFPEYVFSAVRAGAWIYGSASRHFTDPSVCPLAVRLMARITRISAVKKGEYLGYDSDNPLDRDSVIATVSCGYYDGIQRVSSKGYAVIRGKRAPIKGIVMMDQMTVDVTGIEGVSVNDTVTLLGDGISLLEASNWYDCNRNELIARLSRRVPRIYLNK